MNSSVRPHSAPPRETGNGQQWRPLLYGTANKFSRLAQLASAGLGELLKWETIPRKRSLLTSGVVFALLVQLTAVLGVAGSAVFKSVVEEERVRRPGAGPVLAAVKAAVERELVRRWTFHSYNVRVISK